MRSPVVIVFIFLFSINALVSRADEPVWQEKVMTSHVDFDAVAADGEAAIAALIARGKVLFAAKFTEADGRGRPKATQAIIPTKRKRGETASFQCTGGPDASACSSCHNEPFPGGAGDFVANVFVNEGFESVDFDSLDPSFSSERNTNSLFGDGLVELLAREMTDDLQALRQGAVKEAWATSKDVDVKLVTKGVSFGWLTIKANGIANFSRLEGVDNDLVVRPFSQKGVFTSLRQFTINAVNQHHGMEASERFGVRFAPMVVKVVMRATPTSTGPRKHGTLSLPFSRRLSSRITDAPIDPCPDGGIADECGARRRCAEG